MNSTTEANLNDTINWLKEVGGQAQAFTIEQAPIYCKEVIQWEVNSSLILIGISLSLFLVTAIGIVLGWKLYKKTDDENFIAAPCVGGTFLVFIALILGPIGVRDYYKAKTAPRVILVNHFKDILK